MEKKNTNSYKTRTHDLSDGRRQASTKTNQAVKIKLQHCSQRHLAVQSQTKMRPVQLFAQTFSTCPYTFRGSVFSTIFSTIDPRSQLQSFSARSFKYVLEILFLEESVSTRLRVALELGYLYPRLSFGLVVGSAVQYRNATIEGLSTV